MGLYSPCENILHEGQMDDKSGLRQFMTQFGKYNL